MVAVTIPDDMAAEIMAAVQRRIDAALSVADKEARQIIIHRAMLDNEDVDGNQMPQKQGRPKADPQNHPGLPIFDSGEMVGPDRWTTQRVSDTEVNLIYSPPDYLEYLIEKDPEHGGRKWILPDRINESARNEINELMAKRFKEASD